MSRVLVLASPSCSAPSQVTVSLGTGTAAAAVSMSRSPWPRRHCLPAPGRPGCHKVVSFAGQTGVDVQRRDRHRARSHTVGTHAPRSRWVTKPRLDGRIRDGSPSPAGREQATAGTK